MKPVIVAFALELPMLIIACLIISHYLNVYFRPWPYYTPVLISLAFVGWVIKLVKISNQIMRNQSPKK